MVKKRNEISDNYKWDLSSIYKNIDEFNIDYDLVKELSKQYVLYKDNLMDNATNLYNCLELDQKIDRILSKLYSYAHMNNDADTTDTFYQTLFGKVKNLLSEVSSNSSFIRPTLLSSDYEIIEKFYLDEPRLKEYEKNLRDIYRYKKHTLSKEQEHILSTLNKSIYTSENIYSLLTDADMKFGTILNENNEEVELTDSNFSIYIRSKNRQVRINAFDKLYTVYGNFKNTISETLATDINATVTIDKLRGYNSSLESSLYDDEVSTDVYNNLIKTVHNNLDVLYKYYEEKRKMLNLDEFHLYDVYAEVIDDNNKKYPFEDGKQLVIDATKVLGNDYTNNLMKAFDEKWIDVYPNVGKRGGAYSGGCFDTKPFVLLNYQDTLGDVSTLAHELGHSIHSYYTRHNNPYQTGDYRIFVAEVASTVNELLLYKHMIKKSNNKQEKLTILNHILDLYKSTIYRQTMFAEFEKIIYEKIENNEILTNDVLCNTYYDLNKLYFGDNVVVDDLIKNEWMKVPHFYYNFYVYKYATGLSCASKIVSDILSNKENAVENYIEFLKSGSKESPLELLKKTGCDLTKPDVIESAIEMFKDTLEEFIEVYNS